MRLQNNQRSQALADKQARQDDCFFFADYIGIHDGRLVYRASHEDSRVYIEGFPILIYVDAEGNVSESFGEESLEILGSISHRDYRRGREIYRRYKRLLETGECAPLEREYCSKVVSIIERIEDYMPLDINTVFLFLEAADRLGMRLEICIEEDMMYDTDVPYHYVSLMQESDNGTR